VTPFSWPSSTCFGGPPQLPLEASGIMADACYIHALVHRREGTIPGEFGSGFNNCRFWLQSTGTHAAFPALARAFTTHQLSGPGAQLPQHAAEYCAAVAKRGWQAGEFVDLCERALACGDASFVQACEAVVRLEWRVLLAHLAGRWRAAGDA